MGQCELCSRWFPVAALSLACACLMVGCDRESGDECEPILLCPECV